MNFNKVFMIIVAFLLMTVGTASAADVAKIGVFNFQQILQKSQPGKVAQAKITEKGKTMEQDLKTKAQEIVRLQENLEREAMVMTKEMRSEKEREVEIKKYDHKALQRKYLAEMKKFERELIKEVTKDVEKVVEKIGKDGNFLLIMERRTAGVMYAPETLDITDQIINDYNVFKATASPGKSE